MLEFRVLGELAVVRNGAALTLPPSRKTRALLAYLALTRRRHRREELCEIFWDVPDDPRGALRWSLSKIRPFVDDPSHPRLVADRQTVELRTEELDVDLFAAQACAGAEDAGTNSLARAAALFRGPLLADLDLAANSEFHSWLLGLREDARKLQSRILRALTEQLGATPPEALPFARELVRIDRYDETAWALLITTLALTGRIEEARHQYEAGQRALREIGGESGPLLRAWRSARASAETSPARDAQEADALAAERSTSAIPAAVSNVQAGSASRLSIIVLPFANLSHDPEQQHFVDGITGDLTTDLSRIPDMLVISRNTAFTYRNKPVDTKQIGRELGVRYVLDGEVQRSGSRVRVTAQLIDAETDVHLWAERFDGDAGDLFALQDEVTNRIAIALDLELVEAAAARPIARPDAHDYILRGRAARLRPPSRENRAEQVLLFERALALDRDSVAAQSWLAIELAARALDFMTDTAAADIARAEGLAGQAVAASPRSSLARFAKAQVLRAQHRYDAAILEYETVIALNRNWAHAYSHLGWCKFMTGSIEALVPAQEQAIRLSPRDPQIGLFYSRIGRAHLLQSRIDEAITWCEKARNATPAAAIFRSFLASAYALKGDVNRAAAELDEARRLVGGNRYSSIARLRTVDSWGVPRIQALMESTYFAGLRKAGVPETD
ncbi:MAG TPA: BTAD domain-containing putative transcriptional regulator [Stellaceae bacterium]|nr:BTAD domain-containing putative transcriptional regulator [Stellaceae bacterium]